MTFKRFGGLSRRIYLAFLLAAAIPTAIAGAIGVYYSLEILKSETLHNLGQEVGVRAQGIGRFFSQLSAELLYLSGSRPLRELREALATGETGRIVNSKERLEQDFANFVSLYPHVYQLRYLGPEGREIVRVDRRGDKVYVVPRDKLQDKSDRYYFREAIRNRPGEIYVSPLDLNIEFGQVEKPERPVIRVATPVAASGGLLIVNLHADILLEQVQQMADTRNGVAYLFDRSGHFLVRSADNVPGAFSMQPIERLADKYSKTVIERILARVNGTEFAGGQILTHAAVDFLPAGKKEGKWVIALSFPESRLFLSLFNFYALYAVLLVSLIATAIGGYALSRRLLGPLDDLSRESEAIASGDFSRRVDIAGKDEIADLGQRFNMMAEKLDVLYRSLNRQRDRLEEEVTERTRELEQERAFLSAVIQHTDDGILAVEATGQVTLANTVAAAMLGPHPIPGCELAGSWPQWPEIAAEAANGPLRRDLELPGRVLALSVTPLRETGGFIVVARDVSEERRLQDDRRELDRQIFQMEKLSTLGELAMGLAHEIGNPLAGMKAVVQAMLDEENLDQDLRRKLGRIENEVDRLSVFLRTFHGFSAPQETHPAACQLKDIIEDVFFWTRKEAHSRGVNLAYEQCSKVIPALWADPNQLKQLLLNLVLNAIHMMENGGEVVISMCVPRTSLEELSAEVPRVRFCVRDNGPGIAPEVLPRIFDPFFTTRENGSGLGLAVVKKIASQHGASIHVESKPGQGTRFEFVWPMVFMEEDQRAEYLAQLALSATGCEYHG